MERIGIVTSKEHWFVPYARQLQIILTHKGYDVTIFFDHAEASHEYEIIFMLGYCQLVKREDLVRHKHNIVVHESDLPQGKGWSPLFWQILEGKNRVPIVLFEAIEAVDAGPVYVRDIIELTGYELHDEIRVKQAEKTIELCVKFLDMYPRLQELQKNAVHTCYPRRRPKDSELDVTKSLKELFPNLRIASNEEYPAYFMLNGRKYILKIEAGDNK